MPNSTMQDLLAQYTSKIKGDNRVFSKDVMGRDQFGQMFDPLLNGIVDNYLRPDYLRYQYDPYMRSKGGELGNLNQQIGLSGAWRSAQSGNDLDSAAQDAMLGQEQLNRQFGDQVLGVKDQFQSGLIDPLYKSRMTNFYENPTRDMDLGNVTPQMNSTIPGLQGFAPNQVGGNNIAASTGNVGMPMAQPMNGMGGGQQQQQGMPSNLFSQYLKRPMMQQNNVMGILGGQTPSTGLGKSFKDIGSSMQLPLNNNNLAKPF